MTLNFGPARIEHLLETTAAKKILYNPGLVTEADRQILSEKYSILLEEKK